VAPTSRFNIIISTTAITFAFAAVKPGIVCARSPLSPRALTRFDANHCHNRRNKDLGI
jgi:hypothetical protein